MKYNISRFNPCHEAQIFYSLFSTSEEAWKKCHRGDWMLWIASKLQVDDRKLVLAKALCAYTVHHLMRDKRSRNAVYVAFMYGRGKATKDELNAAAAYAYDAAYDAAYAAAYAAYAYDAYAYAYDAAKKQNQMETANICRKVLTECVFEKIKEEQK